MSRYFTSDLHLNSTHINKYANRPIHNALNAALFLINNANSVLKKEDLLIHVGDFCLISPDRHGNEEDIPIDISPEHWMSCFNSRLMLLAGNHDDGHSFETDAKSMTLDLNQNYWNVSVAHYPSTHEFYRYVGNGNRNSCSGGIHIHLCGHVHDKWLLNFDAEHKVLNVNAGVDVWGYKPVRDSEITELLDYFRATMWTKISPSPGKWTNFALTRKALDEFKIAHSAEVKAQREAKKQERYAKKGLTPEIREQRKQEGIKLSKIKKLHMMTGAGMGSCKEALDACGYDDLQKAKAWLVERGLNIAMKTKIKTIGI